MNQRFILTGSPGSGKTTILRELSTLGVAVIPEPAREVLSGQRAQGGDGVSVRNPSLFCDLMLSRAIVDRESAADVDGPTVFDRGIPDQVGYYRLLGLPDAAALRAAIEHRYANQVFVTPSWPEIYTTDDERTMTFEQAEAFGGVVRQIYYDLGYALHVLPRDTARARAEIIAAAVDAL